MLVCLVDVMHLGKEPLRSGDEQTTQGVAIERGFALFLLHSAYRKHASSMSSGAPQFCRVGHCPAGVSTKCIFCPLSFTSMLLLGAYE